MTVTVPDLAALYAHFQDRNLRANTALGSLFKSFNIAVPGKHGRRGDKVFPVLPSNRRTMFDDWEQRKISIHCFCFCFTRALW